MSQYLNIGGLVAIGFDSTGEYMLTISQSGRGVYRTDTLEGLARDTELAYPEAGFGVGIHPIHGRKKMGMVILVVLCVCLAIGSTAFLLEMVLFGWLMRILSRGSWTNFFLIAILFGVLVSASSIFVIVTSEFPQEIGKPFSQKQWNAFYVLGLTPGIAGLFALIALIDTRHDSTRDFKSKR